MAEDLLETVGIAVSLPLRGGLAIAVILVGAGATNGAW
jgi:TRAP-type mannitol/chloroaromatic compound transport system permease large subunit